MGAILASALKAALVRLNVDQTYAADAIKTIGYVPEYATGPNTDKEVQEGLAVSPQMRAFIIDYVKRANK